MTEVDRNAVLHACRTMLRPVAGFLLKCGLTYREFAELAKSVFVEVASKDFGIGGRPTNVTRVSLLTGISRKEVKRQRELLENPPEPRPNRTTDATRVLSGWHQDTDFLDDSGKPVPLRFESSGTDFTELCRRYGGDIAPTAMLKELLRVGAVAETEDGLLEVRQRYFLPTQFDPQWIMNAGGYFADLGANIKHNLQAGEGEPTNFLGRAADDWVSADALPEFRDFIEQHGQPFLELVDDWLTEHRATAQQDNDAERVRLGVGVFLIQDARDDELDKE